MDFPHISKESDKFIEMFTNWLVIFQEQKYSAALLVFLKASTKFFN